MQIYTSEQIRRALDVGDLLGPVTEAFKAYSRGDASDAISHIHPNDGDVHIKAGYIRGSKIFALKVANGFVNNRALGLPIWDGLVIAFSAETGQPVALLQDGGLLTDWRTAAAGAVATRALAPHVRTLGVVGSGLQAFWQPLAHKAALPAIDHVRIWARAADRADEIAVRLRAKMIGVQIETCVSLETLVRSSDAIVTTTASHEPLIQRDWLRAGQHVTAVGADDDSKQELDLDIVRDASVIVVDAREVNQRYGEVARAIATGRIELMRCIELGELLANPTLIPDSMRGGYTLAKLIGLGVQDLVSVEAALAMLEDAPGSARVP